MINNTFISMCQEATELQEQWEPKIRDLFLDTFEGYNIVTDVHYGLLEEYEKGENIKKHRFWVPRQEDLQKIISKKEGYSDAGTLKEFFDWAEKQSFALDYLSMNQMWISFTMELIYNKQWNGETWVEL